MANIHYIPSGIKNLSSLFPSINFNNIESYYLEVIDEDDNIIATTNTHNKKNICTDDIYIHFINSLGCIDSCIFKLSNIDYNVKSDNIRTPLHNSIIKNILGLNRTNINTETIHEAEIEILEEDIPWITELFDSPYVWLERNGIQGQSDDYIPILLADQKINIRKSIERYSYSIPILFTLSNEKINIRG